MAENNLEYCEPHCTWTGNVCTKHCKPGQWWEDSYEQGGVCFCTGKLDHGIGEVKINTPIGPQKLKDVCEAQLAKHGSTVSGGKIYYNDIQCGHGPPNNHNMLDEELWACPGQVERTVTNKKGQESKEFMPDPAFACQVIGPAFDLCALYDPQNSTVFCDSQDESDAAVTTTTIATSTTSEGGTVNKAPFCNAGSCKERSRRGGRKAGRTLSAHDTTIVDDVTAGSTTIHVHDTRYIFAGNDMRIVGRGSNNAAVSENVIVAAVTLSPDTVTLSASPTTAAAPLAPAPTVPADVDTGTAPYTWIREALQLTNSRTLLNRCCLSTTEDPPRSTAKFSSAMGCKTGCGSGCFGFEWHKKVKYCRYFTKPLEGLIKESSIYCRCYKKDFESVQQSDQLPLPVVTTTATTATAIPGIVLLTRGLTNTFKRGSLLVHVATTAAPIDAETTISTTTTTTTTTSTGAPGSEFPQQPPAPPPTPASLPSSDKIELLASSMTQAAKVLLASLTKKQQAAITYPMSSGIRKTGDMRPQQYNGDASEEGVLVSAMSSAAQTYAKALLHAGLSKRGQVSIDLAGPERNSNGWGDFSEYTFAIFGTPGTNSPWGWRYQGWHVSVHFTVDPSTDGVSLESLPFVIGTDNMVASEEADDHARVIDFYAFKLLDTFTAAQKSKIVQGDNRPHSTHIGEIGSGGYTPTGAGDASRGVGYDEMTTEQQDAFKDVLEQFAVFMAPAIAEQRMEVVDLQCAAFPKLVRFVWFGTTDVKGKGSHYFQLIGASFVAEATGEARCPTKSKCLHFHLSWQDVGGGNWGSNVESYLMKHLLEDIADGEIDDPFKD